MNLKEFLLGGGTTEIPAGVSVNDKFLHVVEHGINWEAESGERSSYDFAQEADFDVLLERAPDLLARYVSYAQDHVVERTESDPSFAGGVGYDDSIVDAIFVLDKIVEAAKRTGKTATISGRQAGELIDFSIEYESMLEDPDEDDIKAFSRLREVIRDLAGDGVRRTPKYIA